MNLLYEPSLDGVTCFAILFAAIRYDESCTETRCLQRSDPDDVRVGGAGACGERHR